MLSETLIYFSNFYSEHCFFLVIFRIYKQMVHIFSKIRHFHEQLKFFVFFSEYFGRTGEKNFDFWNSEKEFQFYSKWKGKLIEKLSKYELFPVMRYAFSLPWFSLWKQILEPNRFREHLIVCAIPIVRERRKCNRNLMGPKCQKVLMMIFHSIEILLPDHPLRFFHQGLNRQPSTCCRWLET